MNPHQRKAGTITFRIERVAKERFERAASAEYLPLHIWLQQTAHRRAAALERAPRFDVLGRRVVVGRVSHKESATGKNHSSAKVAHACYSSPLWR